MKQVSPSESGSARSNSHSMKFQGANGTEVGVGRFRGVTAQLEALLAKLSEEHEREVSSLRLRIRQLEAELLSDRDKDSPHFAVVRPRARTPRGAISGKAQQGEAGAEKTTTSFETASPLPIIFDSEDSADVANEATERVHQANGMPFPSEATSFPAFPSECKLSDHSSQTNSQEQQVSPSSPLPVLQVGTDFGSHASGDRSSHDSGSAEIFFPRDIWCIPDDMIKGIRRKSWDNIGESSLRMTQSLRRSSADLSVSLEAQEERNIASSHCCFLHPQSNRRIAWDIFGLFFVGYDVIMVPLQVFDLPEDNTFFVIMQNLGAIFWTVDLILNFFTGFYVRGILEARPSAIARHYLKTWFILDISIVVTEWIDIIVDSSSDSATSTVRVLRAIRVVRCLRMVRLLRLLKLVRIEMVMQDLEAQIHSNSLLLLFGILKLIMGLMLINHIIACVWYWIGKSSQKGWPNRNLESNSGMYFYLTAVHWSLTQFQASMEIHPHTPGERAYGIFVVLVALILFSSFLSSITNMMRQLQSLHQERTRRQRVLQEYLKEHGISTALQVRVRRFLFTDLDERHELEAQMEAMLMLPRSLLMDVHNEAFGPHLAMHQFFVDLREENPRLVRQLCHESLTESISQSEDTIFCTGDACAQMLWIHKGLLEYKIGRQKAVVASSSIKQLRREISLTDQDWEEVYNVRAAGTEELGKDRWLSEPVLWTPWEHTGDCKTLETSVLLIMDALTFCKVIRRYESVHILSALYARKFVEELNKALHPSDLMLPPENSDVATLRQFYRSESRGAADMGRSFDCESIGSRMSRVPSLRSTRTGLS